MDPSVPQVTPDSENLTTNSHRRSDVCRNSRIDNQKDDRFRCLECGFRSESKRGIIGHRKIHSKKSQFECKSCAFSAKSKASLTYHMRRVHWAGDPEQERQQEDIPTAGTGSRDVPTESSGGSLAPAPTSPNFWVARKGNLALLLRRDHSVGKSGNKSNLNDPQNTNPGEAETDSGLGTSASARSECNTQKTLKIKIADKLYTEAECRQQTSGLEKIIEANHQTLVAKDQELKSEKWKSAEVKLSQLEEDRQKKKREALSHAEQISKICREVHVRRNTKLLREMNFRQQQLNRAKFRLHLVKNDIEDSKSLEKLEQMMKEERLAEEDFQLSVDQLKEEELKYSVAVRRSVDEEISLRDLEGKIGSLQNQVKEWNASKEAMRNMIADQKELITILALFKRKLEKLRSFKTFQLACERNEKQEIEMLDLLKSLGMQCNEPVQECP